MQNIDYSRRLKQISARTPIRENADFDRTIQTVQHGKKSGSPIQIFSSTRSAFILLLGSVSLFTAGLVVGLKLDQKEKLLLETNSKHSETFLLGKEKMRMVGCVLYFSQPKKPIPWNL